jgi:hypothetical protein
MTSKRNDRGLKDGQWDQIVTLHQAQSKRTRIGPLFDDYRQTLDKSLLFLCQIAIRKPDCLQTSMSVPQRKDSIQAITDWEHEERLALIETVLSDRASEPLDSRFEGYRFDPGIEASNHPDLVNGRHVLAGIRTDVQCLPLPKFQMGVHLKWNSRSSAVNDKLRLRLCSHTLTPFCCHHLHTPEHSYGTSARALIARATHSFWQKLSFASPIWR